jgi:hypothetical protein
VARRIKAFWTFIGFCDAVGDKRHVCDAMFGCEVVNPLKKFGYGIIKIIS